MRHSRPCSSPATHITCAPPCSYSSPAQRLSSTTTASLPPMPQIFPIESSLTHLQTAPAVASQNQPHRRSLSRSEIQFLPPAPPWPRPRPPYRPPTHENALPTVVYHHCWRSPQHSPELRRQPRRLFPPHTGTQRHPPHPPPHSV